MPEIVVLPSDVEQVSNVVKLAKQADVPIVPRGSGTGLAGGAVPAEGGIVLSLARLNRILKIDLENRIAIVEPGVINQMSRRPSPKTAFSMRPTRAVRPHVRSAATSPTTPAARTRSPTASRPITYLASKSCSTTAQSFGLVAKCRTCRVTISAACSSARKAPWESSPKSAVQTDADPRVGAHVTSHF